MTVASATPSPTGLVRATDRCDRCGAEALVRVVLTKSSLPLLFCAHHYGERAEQLAAVAEITHDDRAKVATATNQPAGDRRDPRGD